MQDTDESERLRTALKRLVDESERVAWQGANDDPPTYPHLAAIIDVAKDALAERQKLTEWVIVQRGFIVAPENQRWMRVTSVQPTGITLSVCRKAVTLEDGKIYLSDYTPEVGSMVLAHVPLDGCGFITSA